MPPRQRVRDIKKTGVKQREKNKRNSVEPAQKFSGTTLQRAILQPGLLNSGEVLQLQRAIGNRATAGLLSRQGKNSRPVQAKLNTGSPRGLQWQESDRTAARGVGLANLPGGVSRSQQLPSDAGLALQLKAAKGKDAAQLRDYSISGGADAPYVVDERKNKGSRLKNLEKDEPAGDMGIASSSFGTISGLIEMAQALRSMWSDDLSKSNAELTEGVVANAGGIPETDGSSRKFSGRASSGLDARITGSIGDTLEGMKRAFFIIMDIYDLWKKYHNEKGIGSGERFETGMKLVSNAVASGSAAAKTLKGFLETFNQGAGGLAQAVPALGIAISGAAIAVQVYEQIRADNNKKNMQKVKEEFKKYEPKGHGARIYLAQETKTKRIFKKFRVSSVKVDMEKLKQRKQKLRRKMTAGGIKPSVLDRKLKSEAGGRSKEEMAPIAQALRGGVDILTESQVIKLLREKRDKKDIENNIAGAKRKIDARHKQEFLDLREYEIAIAFTGLNKERKNKSDIKVGEDLVNIAGDIANLDGTDAIAGGVMKAVVSGVKLEGGIFSRIAQWVKDKTGGEKSTQSVFEKRKEHARLIMKMVAGLPQITTEQEREQHQKTYESVESFIKASGCSPQDLYKLNGNVLEQYMLLINSITG